MYLVIYNSDGDTHIVTMSREDLEERLNQHYWGTHAHYLNAIPNHDTNYWPENAVLIVKAEIVVPVPEEVILRMRIP